MEAVLFGGFSACAGHRYELNSLFWGFFYCLICCKPGGGGVIRGSTVCSIKHVYEIN